MSVQSRTYNVRHDGSTLSVSGYYSITYDVLAIVGEEDDAHVVVVASFDDARNAESFVTQTDDSRYVIGVRPPNRVVDDAVKWLALVASSRIETIPTQPYRP